MGLSIAKQIVDIHGGSIRFKSDPKIKPGTICIILLPLRICEDPSDFEEDDFHIQNSQSPIPSSTNKTCSNSNHGPKRGSNSENDNVSVPNNSRENTSMIEESISILITDDIKMNREMLKRRLKKCIVPNCVIYEAANGEEAIKLCEKMTFDVIIMDQYMEGSGGIMVGTDTIIALRDRIKVQSFIIGCSGNDIEGGFLAAGADLVWKKPIPSNETIIQQLRSGLTTI